MITRINLVLLLLLVSCALSLVTAQHRARKTFMELTKQREIAETYAVDFDRLRLEQRTWAMHSRIEKVARLNLKMQAPDEKRIRILSFPARP